MRVHARHYGNHNMILYNSFMAFVEQTCQQNCAFEYRARMFLHFGPLLELFDFSTAHTWGLDRETCYLLQTPTYAQLGLRNYFTECFIHTINFIAKWPLAFCKMLQLNSSVNLSGKKGSAIEHDCFVETCIVQPIKASTSGQSTVKSCQRIAGCIDLIKSMKDVYSGKLA